MPDTLLHQWEMSPFCNKARRMLVLKGIDFEVRNYNGLLARNAARLSTQGTLPVLDFDGRRIVDSAAIAVCLERARPQPVLLPADPVVRAQARIWEDWAGKTLYGFEIYFRMLIPGPREKALDLICDGRPSWERMLLRMIFKRRYPQKLRWDGLGRLSHEQVLKKFFGHLDDLETILASRPWLSGDSSSIADVSVAAQLDEILRTSEIADRIRDGYPAIMDWLRKQGPLARPA